MNEREEQDFCEALNDAANAEFLIAELRRLERDSLDRHALTMAQAYLRQAMFFLREARTGR